MTNKITFKDRVEWAVRWVVIGDALWLPFEKRTMEDIKATFGEVKDYIAVWNNTFLEEERKNNKSLAVIHSDIGVISDDTIFTLAGMKAIVESWKIELDRLFRIHKNYIDSYWPHRFWWVRERFATFTPDKPLSHLAYPSWWNWVMMKQFPYAAYLVAAKTPLDEQDTIVESITAVTHNAPVTKYVCLVHNRMLWTLLTSDPETFDMWKTLDELYRMALIYESRIPNNEQNANANFLVTPILTKLQKQRISVQEWKPYTYQEILDTYLVVMTWPEAVGMKAWFHVASTLWLVYACFMQNMNFQWVIDAISIWQDTDSQGSMVWAMVWALRWPFYEQKYIDWIKNKQTISQELDDFQNTIATIQQWVH